MKTSSWVVVAATAATLVLLVLFLSTAGDLTRAEADLAKVKADLTKAEADLAKVKADLAKSQTDLAKTKAALAKCQAPKAPAASTATALAKKAAAAWLTFYAQVQKARSLTPQKNRRNNTNDSWRDDEFIRESFYKGLLQLRTEAKRISIAAGKAAERELKGDVSKRTIYLSLLVSASEELAAENEIRGRRHANSLVTLEYDKWYKPALNVHWAVKGLTK